MEGVKNFETVNKFQMKLPENQLFCFGVQLGDGTDEKKLRLGLTSKRLLKNIACNCVFHVDLTYKIIKQSYPLLVFGCSDVSVQFHPIALMFLSHWKQDDFEHFFNSLLLLTKKVIRKKKSMINDHYENVLADIRSLNYCTTKRSLSINN